jgi:cellobiose phosphorylase
VRPAYGGLEIAPVVPADWTGFSVTRLYQGVVFEIEVERQGAGNKVSLVVDGEPVAGIVAPMPENGRSTVKVQAIIK